MKKAFFIAVMMLLLVPAAVMAQDAGQPMNQAVAANQAVATAGEAGDDVFDLGEIVVTGIKSASPVTNTVAEITSADFEKLGMQNVPDALKEISGVWVTVGMKNEPDITVRGFTQNKVLVLLDGIPLADAYNSKLNLSSIPLESIAKITVTKGPASSIYGPNAMGGVISIVTKKFAEKPAGSLTLGAGDDSSNTAQLAYGGAVGRTYFFLGASKQNTDGFKLSNGFIPTKPAVTQAARRRLNSDYDKENYSLKIGRTTERADEYAISYNMTKSFLGVPVQAYDPTLGSKFSRYARFTDWQSWALDFSALQNVTQNWNLREMVYYHKYDNTYESFTDKTFTTYINPLTAPAASSMNVSVYDDHTVGYRLISESKILNGDKLTISLNQNKDVHNQHSYAAATAWQSYTTKTTSLGSELFVPLGAKWHITPGASYEVFEAGTGAEKKNNLNPQLGLTYDLDENNHWHFAYGKKTRYPTQSELFSSSSGNNNLQPSYSKSFETGMDVNFSQRLGTGLTYFYNDVRDLIDKDSKGISQNISRALFAGSELYFEKFCNGKPCWKVSHTWLRARNRSNGSLLERTPKSKIDFEFTYPWIHTISFTFSGSYVGARYQASNTPKPLFNAPYLVMNQGVSGKLRFMNSEWRLFVDNVFDKNYEQEYGYPLPGRTFRAEIKYNF